MSNDVPSDQIASLLSSVLSGNNANTNIASNTNTTSTTNAATEQAAPSLSTPQPQPTRLQLQAMGKTKGAGGSQQANNSVCFCGDKRKGNWVPCSVKGCKIKVCTASVLGLSKAEAKEFFTVKKQKFVCRECAGATADDDAPTCVAPGTALHRGGLPAVSLFDTPFKCCNAQMDVGDPHCIRCVSCEGWFHAKCLHVSERAAKLLRYHRTQYVCIDCIRLSVSNNNDSTQTKSKRPRSSDDNLSEEE